MPANPFPEPTNGKAVAMWKHVKDLAVPDASHSTDNAIQHEGDDGGGDGRGSPAIAGIAQAAMAAALSATRKTEESRAPSCVGDSDAAELPPVCGESDGGCAGGGLGKRGERETSGCWGELESSKPIRLGDAQGGDGVGSSSKGMRQESYYLRGAIEAERDRDLLATIADCIPGTMTLGSTLRRSMLTRYIHGFYNYYLCRMARCASNYLRLGCERMRNTGAFLSFCKQLVSCLSDGYM